MTMKLKWQTQQTDYVRHPDYPAEIAESKVVNAGDPVYCPNDRCYENQEQKPNHTRRNIAFDSNVSIDGMAENSLGNITVSFSFCADC